MKTILHKADTRGASEYASYESYLKVKHTFTFAPYKNRERHLFGVLETLNDMVLSTKVGFGLDKYNVGSWNDLGRGFSKHFHGDVEIVTIPLRGEIEFQDNKGYYGQVKAGEVHVTSTGGGIQHSEFNIGGVELELLELWFKPHTRFLPQKKAKRVLDEAKMLHGWDLFIAPDGENESLPIYQDVRMAMGKPQAGATLSYKLHHPDHYLYLFVIAGSVTVGGVRLDARDGLGIAEVESIAIEALSDTQILLIELPDVPGWDTFLNAPKA